MKNFDDYKTVLEVVKNIPQQSQVQYDLNRQLRELRVAANKLGLYDAGDFLRLKTEQNNEEICNIFNLFSYNK